MTCSRVSIHRVRAKPTSPCVKASAKDTPSKNHDQAVVGEVESKNHTRTHLTPLFGELWAKR